MRERDQDCFLAGRVVLSRDTDGRSLERTFRPLFPAHFKAKPQAGNVKTAIS